MAILFYSWDWIVSNSYPYLLFNCVPLFCQIHQRYVNFWKFRHLSEQAGCRWMRKSSITSWMVLTTDTWSCAIFHALILSEKALHWWRYPGSWRLSLSGSCCLNFDLCQLVILPILATHSVGIFSTPSTIYMKTLLNQVPGGVLRMEGFWKRFTILSFCWMNKYWNINRRMFV